MLSTNKTFFIGFDRSKSARNVKLSSKSAILLISQPFKTGLKHDAVDKNNVFQCFGWVKISLKREALVKFNNFINFAASQNGPETRCCRQKQRFFMVLWWVKISLKREALAKFSNFINVRSLSKQAWNTMLSSKHVFFDTFFAGPKSPETRSSRRKMTIFSPAIVYENGIFK